MKKLMVLLGFVLLVGCYGESAMSEEIVEEAVEEVIEIELDECIERQLREYKEDELLDCSKDEEVVFVDPILDIVNNMSIQQKVGQLVMVGVEGESIDERIEDLIRDRYVGGVCLFARNIVNKEQLTKLTEDLQLLNVSNTLPLFIAIDEEGGRVSRLQGLGYDFPSAYSVGATGDKEYAYENAKSIGETLSGYGINMNFAPVLDIHSNPDNPIIGDRAFGSTAELVSEMGISSYQGLQDTGIIGVGKHFPGHGDTDVDSHMELPLVSKTKDELMELELVPFIDAIEAGMDMLMVAHIMEEEIDQEWPSSMSEKVITDLLREELGYNGVVITDDIVMGAITNDYSVGEAAVRSIQAGSDIILVCHGYENQVEVLEALLEAVLDGEISMKRLDESVYRILKLKDRVRQ